jgi:hypothetical protein
MVGYILVWSDLRFLRNSKTLWSVALCLLQPTFGLQLFKILRSSTRASALKIENYHSRVKILGWPINRYGTFLIENMVLF